MNIAVQRCISIGSLFFAFMLSACQPPGYDVTASLSDGKLLFNVEFPGFWPFKGSAEQAEASYLEVVTSHQIIWAIEAEDKSRCTTATENPDYREPTYLRFPLAFGVTPNCYVTVVSAKPVPEGMPILVRARGELRQGSGQFELRNHQIVAVSDGHGVSSSAPTRNAHWQAETAQTLEATKVR